MNKYLISIIIPVYNVQEYVEKCILSVLNQDVSPDTYEIIIVNDGSTDNSLEIISRFAEQHANIKIINQENKGLSGTRNTGLSVAQGKFVWFIDSDDWIENNCLNKLLNILSTNNLDILLIKLVIVDENGIITQRKELPSFNGRIITGKELYNHLGLSWNVVRYIYLRDMLVKNNLYFENGILFEDGAFLDKVFFYAKRVKIFNETIYYYFQRTGSIVNSLRNIDKRQDSFFTLAQKATEFSLIIDDGDYKKLLKQKIISYICQCLNYQSINHKKDFRKQLQTILPISYKDETISSKIRIFLINNLPSLYGWMMRRKDIFFNK